MVRCHNTDALKIYKLITSNPCNFSDFSCSLVVLRNETSIDDINSLDLVKEFPKLIPFFENEIVNFLTAGLPSLLFIHLMNVDTDRFCKLFYKQGSLNFDLYDKNGDLLFLKRSKKREMLVEFLKEHDSNCLLTDSYNQILG